MSVSRNNMYYVIYVFVCLAPLAICCSEDNEIESHPNWQYLDNQHCGITRINNKQRIINGERAALGQFPWIARMGRQREKYIFFDCGGSLVNKYYVISAAHCGNDHDVVRLGENKLGNATEQDCDDTICAPPVQDIRIEKSILFGYNTTTFNNDLMLSKLASPAMYNEFVCPVCLPFGSLLTKNVVGTYVQIAGWGYTDALQEDTTESLMYFSAPILELEACSKLYKTPISPEIQYCVGYPQDENKDSCGGDSGGPMTRYEEVDGTRRHYLLGIVSYGLMKCGGGPAVYTKIIHYLPELLDAIEQK